MPLIVPGITSNDGKSSKTDDWMNKLVGKKIGEGSDAVVSLVQETSCKSMANSYICKTFAKKDLPQETRIIEPGQMVTKDFKPDRYIVEELPLGLPDD